MDRPLRQLLGLDLLPNRPVLADLDHSMALYIDIVLLLSKSWIVTAIVGSMGFSLLMYSNNWVILVPSIRRASNTALS